MISELAKELEEGEKRYRLCVHVRDWMPGLWIPDLIVTSIRKSKRTIIFLSEDFLNSNWCMHEFKVAHAEMIMERRPLLVIIMFGEFEITDKVDPGLRAHLQTNTYLKWGDQYFWEKLHYALAPTRYD